MYISPSNIVETGYTQGNELFNSLGEYYKGFYHKDNQNRYWTGKEHTNSSIKLTKTVSNNNTIDIYKNNIVSQGFTKIYKNKLDTPFIKNEIIQPTYDDYDKGIFTRYVTQLKSTTHPESNIAEINKITFDKISKDINILKTYRLASFGWKISGPLNDVFENNIKIESGVLDSNLRSLQDVEKVILNLTSFIKNPIQFYIRPISS